MFVGQDSVDESILSVSDDHHKKRDYLKKVLGIRDLEESTKEETIDEKM